MGLDELFEEIRTLLREPQGRTVEAPYTYTNAELILSVRSALRHLRSVGIQTKGVLDTSGTLEPALEEAVGVLVALYVAKNLLEGDMVSRLNSGELGMYFRTGPDVMDTRGSVPAFKEAAARYRERYEVMLTLVLTRGIEGAVFGTQEG